MRINNRWKRVAILFPVLLFLGVVLVWATSKGTLLKAFEEKTSWVEVLQGNVVQTEEIDTDQDTIGIELRAKEAGIYQLPYDDSTLEVTYENGKFPLPYEEVSSELFQVQEGSIVISHPTVGDQTDATDLKSSEKEIEDASEPKDGTGASTETTPAQDSPTLETITQSSIFKVIDQKTPSKRSLYIKLEKGNTVFLRVHNKTTEAQNLSLLNTADPDKKQQSIIRFTPVEAQKASVPHQESSPTEMSGFAPGSTEAEKNGEKPVQKKKDSSNGFSVPVKLETYNGDTKGIIELKDPHLTIQTGEKNFDSDDKPGHDASPSNDIVRTWDKVIYSYAFSVQPTTKGKTYKNIRYRVDAVLKNSRKVVGGQVRDYAYFPEGTQTGNNGTTTRDALYTTSGTLTNSSSIVDSSIVLQVLGATHNYALMPEIKITLLDAVDSSTGETVPVNATSSNLVTKSVKVSAKPNVKATLSDSSSDYQLMSTLTGNPNLHAMAKTLGVKFSVVPLTDKGITRKGSLFEQLYGATYPTGETKVSVQTSAYFRPDSGGKDHAIIYGKDQKQPQITHYGLLYSGHADTNSFSKTPEFTNTTFQNMKTNSPWTMPGSKSTDALHNEIGSVYDSNAVMVNNASPTIINYTVKNPAAIHKDGLQIYGGNTQENVNRTTYGTVASVVSIPYDYIVNKSGTIFTNFKTTEIEYEGEKHPNSSSYTYQRGNKLPGSCVCYNPSLDLLKRKIGTNPAQSWTPAGDGAVYKNQRFYAHGVYDGLSLDCKYMKAITAWNECSFEYDHSRSTESWVSPTQSAAGKVDNVYYGIRKDRATLPNLTVRWNQMDTAYQWYSTYETAKAAGTISAVKIVYEKTGAEAPLKCRAYIPLKAIGPTNNQAKDSSGKPNVIVSANQTSTNKDIPLKSFPTSGSYVPTKYDKNNTLVTYHSPANSYGETLLIVPFTARITKVPMRTAYSSDETVQWKLTPQIDANADDEVTFTIKDTLPKELTYVAGSARYGSQEIEPATKENSDGSTLLTWTLPYHKTAHPIQNLVFDSTINGRKIRYDSTNTTSVTNKAVIFAKNKDGLTDDTIEVLRTAQASTTITKVSTLMIEKSTKNGKLEVGSTDPALSDGEKNTTITYSLYTKNEAKTPMKNTKILDIFPNAADGRGTTFNGTFDLASATASGIVKPKIYYTKQSLPSTMTPNEVDLSSGWTVYNGGRISNVKALYAVYDTLGVGETMGIDFSIVVKGQRMKDALVNSAQLDNYNNNPVQSVYVRSNIIGRTLSGVAWYDDNLDGKKNAGEAAVPNVPVKLYRTSHEKKGFKNELVKADLTGKKFIDDSGNSLIKTDASGKYKFTNLPEGDYVAYFDIAGEVQAQKYKVTKKDSETSSQLPDTSKVDNKTYKTDPYETPTVTEGNFSDSEWKVEQINIGLIRPSKIHLFKYSEGTAIDANKDGKLSDGERASGSPLSGAVFDLYKSDQKEKLTTEITNNSGILEFEGLFPGDYTLVETKAPEGYELLKEPVKITIYAGNQTIPLYLADNKHTELPFTGRNGSLGLFIIVAGSVLIVGFVGVMGHYRPRKSSGGR